MIHVARALFVRSQAPLPLRDEPLPATGTGTGASTKPSPDRSNPGMERSMSKLVARITSDPSDARRTVIIGRFAEVCAALDRLVKEQEALA